MLTTKERIYAIGKSLYFGIVLSCIHEPIPHYRNEAEGYPIQNYFQHLWMNLLIVKHLVLKTEHESTHKFHKMKIRKWLRWQY